ncbi:MAG: preprotein translocase subunit SecG [Nitrospira sp.]|nr:preprotein translocase subunit SecG [Nitrospira sp.]
MFTVLLVIHILACFTMVGVILLQSGKGAEMGAVFGGSSQTLFGSRGAATFLSKVTVVAAAAFMLTALSLAVLSKERSVASSLRELQQSSETPAQTMPAPDTSIPSAPSSSDSGGHEQSHSQQPSSPPPSNP